MMNGINIRKLLLLPIIWGLYYIAADSTVSALTVFPAGIVIRAAALILLSIIIFVRKKAGDLLKVKHIWPRLLLVGTFGFLLDATAFFGFSMCDASIGTALLKCDVLFVNIISIFLYKQSFTKADWFFTIIMLVGIFFVLQIDLLNIQPNWGYVFFLLSALFVSINAFVIKSIQLDKRNPASDMTIAYYNNAITLLYFTAFTFIIGATDSIHMLAHPKVLLAALASGIGQTAIYIIYYHNLRFYPIWLVKVCLLLMPVVTTLLSLIFTKEAVSVSQYIGMAIILMGAGGLLLAHRTPINEN